MQIGASFGSWSTANITSGGILIFAASGEIIISSVDIYTNYSSDEISFVKNSDSYFIHEYLQNLLEQYLG